MPPPDAYIGLYGSHSGDWREHCARRFASWGIATFDPTDTDSWARVTDETGDQLQDLVNTLVARQHEGILGASAVVFHLARRWSSVGPSDPRVHAGDLTAFAARAELGFLAGAGIHTWVHIEPDVLGRNYLWALCSLYPSLRRVSSLEEAMEGARASLLASRPPSR